MSQTQLSVSHNQAEKLRQMLRQDEIVPVKVMAYEGDNIYSILIRNLEVKAYSLIDLRSKIVFVKVKELIPVPNLQLIIGNEQTGAEDFIDSLYESQIPFSNNDLRLVNFVSSLRTKMLLDQNTMLAFFQALQRKSLFSLIPARFFQNSDIWDEDSIRCFTDIYLSNELNPLELEPLFTNNTSFRLIPLSSLLTANYPQLSGLHSVLTRMNQTLSSTPCRLDKWLICFNGQKQLLPVEYLINEKNEITTLQLFINTQNLGLLHVFVKEQILNFEAENNTILKHLEYTLQELKNKIELLFPHLQCRWGIIRYSLSEAS